MNTFYDNGQNEFDDKKMLADRELNVVKIQQCDDLISYYHKLYLNILRSIREKRETMYFYESIIFFKEFIRSPRFLEKIKIISDEHLSKEIISLSEAINSLIEQSDRLIDTVISYKEKRLSLENELSVIDGEVLDEDDHKLVKRIAR